jgi:hypothetical protein
MSYPTCPHDASLVLLVGSVLMHPVVSTMAKVEIDAVVAALKLQMRVGAITVSIVVTLPVLYWVVISHSKHVNY